MSNYSKQKGKDNTQPIHVFIRVRPLSRQEREARSLSCIEIQNVKDLVIKQHGSIKHYSFDRVFGPSTKQVDIYKHVVKPLIPEVLAGYNCTVFAYGQTGTGKTYTMAGGVATYGIPWEGDEHAGLIPRAMTHLFDELAIFEQQYTVRVSYLELYNEELFDLLSDSVETKTIRIYEDQHQKGSVILNGISTEIICNRNQVYSILQKGQEKRRSAATSLNDRSSRSHVVFTIIVHTCETTVNGEELVKTGKLNLVDLAGSENIGRFKAGDRRARETGSINQSLLTLGRVIKALAEKCVHIPYRESKLTRILQDSLGGHTKTSVIATVSLAACYAEETLSTLDYAHRAKYITNKPEVNQRVSQKAWKAEYEKEMDRLRKDLYAARTGTGIYIDKGNYDRIVAEHKFRKEELSEKLVIIAELEEELRQMEEEKIVKEAEWRKIQLSFQEMNKEFTKYYKILQQGERVMHEQEQQFVCRYEMKAETFEKQARYLIEVTESAAKNFQNKIQNLRCKNEQTNSSLKLICEKVTKKCQDIVDQLIYFMMNIKDDNKHVVHVIKDLQEQQAHQYQIAKGFGTNALMEAGNFVHATAQELENAIRYDCERYNEFLKIISTKLNEVQNMSRWVELKIGVAKIREGLLLELNNAQEHANKQRRITHRIMGELKVIGKGMLEIHQCVKVLMDRLFNLEKNVNSLTNINHESMRGINKAQANVELNLLEICDNIQDNVDYKSSLITETMEKINSYNYKENAVAKVLEKLGHCKQNLPTMIEATEIKPDSLSVLVQNFVDITSGHIQKSDETFSGYTRNSDNIQKRLIELNEEVSQNELTLHCMLRDCQESLTDFMHNGLTTVSSNEDVPIRLLPDLNSLVKPIDIEPHIEIGSDHMKSETTGTVSAVDKYVDTLKLLYLYLKIKPRKIHLT